MSTAAGLAAKNTLLKLGNGASPEVFTTIANVSSIDGLSLSAETKDVTSHSTGVRWRQRLATLLDSGDVSFDLFFIPSDAGHIGLLTVFQETNGTTNGLRNWQIWFPDAAPTKYQFSGYITKFNLSMPVDGVITAKMVLSSTGQPNFTAS